MSYKTLLMEIAYPLAVVTLSGPSSHNRVSEQLAIELREAFDQLSQDDAVWAIVLGGEGDAFCLGADPSAIAGLGRGDVQAKLRSLRVAERVAAIEKPVIAALNGDAIDQGLELALACDIRIASSRARFGLTQVKDGFMPWDGGTQRLPRLIGRGRAMEMILASRLVDAREALEIGLVNEVVEPAQVLVRAREVASTVAAHGPIAARYLKEAVLKGLDMTLEHGLRLEADLNFLLQSTSDRAEGIRSFLEKRKPEYRGE